MKTGIELVFLDFGDCDVEFVFCHSHVEFEGLQSALADYYAVPRENFPVAHMEHYRCRKTPTRDGRMLFTLVPEGRGTFPVTVYYHEWYVPKRLSKSTPAPEASHDQA